MSISRSLTRRSRRIDEHALASRLAYFLWDSPPDQELMTLADAGALSASLTEVVPGMLGHEKAARFIEAFAHDWLRLDRHESMTINVDEHPDYTRFVKRDMRLETLHFLRHAVAGNLSARVLIDSDFAMLNQNLAEFYGAPGVEGAQFRPVPVDAALQRGGLLSQGAFLVGHSDGTRPHPIKRAVWLKDRILGSPPPPPPPNVPELDPETPGFEKLTLKQQLEVHRDKASCRDCHRKIDPYGVPFEEFDAVGRVLTNNKGHAVDATSELPDGTIVEGVAGLKRQLLQDAYDQFLAALTQRLFSYATGLDVTYREQPEIDGLAAAARRDDRLGSIILAIVQSESFLQPHTP